MVASLQLRRIDVMGVPFVVVRAVEMEQRRYLSLAAEAEFDLRRYLSLAAEAEFDAALSGLTKGKVLAPRIIWVEEGDRSFLPVPEDRVKILCRKVRERIAFELALEWS